MGEAERLEGYLANLRHWGATSAEMVLHHGPADERTARVHVLEPDWAPMIRRYRENGIAVQFHVSLDPRFATQRWLDEPDALKREYGLILGTLGEVAADQGHTALVLHGASNGRREHDENRAATVGLLRWLAEEVERLPGEASVALELGAAKTERPGAMARSRSDVLSIVEEVDSRRVGICWDLAHDRENAALEPDWAPVPPRDFLRHVVHVHLHDLDEEGEAHCPLVFEHVPFREQLAALAGVGPLPAVTMEIRWRCAARLGDPWELLGESYRVAEAALAGTPAHD